MPSTTLPTLRVHPAPRPRKRLNPEERERMIVDEAIRFFAEQGLEGKTRDLADRLDITQPLLYRYFPSKESLIERVYQEVFVQRWNPAWEKLIADRGRTLQDRLTTFYQEYAGALYDYVWVRIFLFSALKGENMNQRYLTIIRAQVLAPVCAELRHDAGLPGADEVPIGDEEIEMAWGLHGMFFYRAVRHFAYGLPLPDDIDKAIENDVSVFLSGAPAAHAAIIKRAKAK